MRTGASTTGNGSPIKKEDKHIVYRAIDENRRIITGGRTSDPNDSKIIDAEYTSSSPSKIDQLMRPVRQTISSNNKVQSPTKSHKQRHSQASPHTRDHNNSRIVKPGDNDMPSNVHSQSMASLHNGGRSKGPKDARDPAPGQAILDSYPSQQHYNSTNQIDEYHTEDQVNEQAHHFTVSSVNDTSVN